MANYPQNYPGHPPHGYGGGHYQSAHEGVPYQSVNQGGPYQSAGSYQSVNQGGPYQSGYQHQIPSHYNSSYQHQGSIYDGGPSQQGGHRPHSGPPPGIDPTIWEWFKSVDADHSGQISAIELRQALVNSNWSHFNEETCRLLIGMFDKDGNGTIDVHEFGALWKYVQDWKGCFDRFDADRSGNISSTELQTALCTFGYRLSINFCQLCTRLFDRADCNSMKFDDFIQCCVLLRSLTESFKRLDTDKDGVIDVSYEQFLEMAIDNTVVNK